MSPLINPIGLRLNLNTYWNYKINNFYRFDSKFFYAECLMIDRVINKFVAKHFMLSFGLIHSHSVISFNNKVFKVYVFLYEGR